MIEHEASDLRPIARDIAVAPDRWRDLGVTHWHCVQREPERASDPKRFDNDRMRTERVRSSAYTASSPDEVLEWLTKVTDDLAVNPDRVTDRAETWLRMAEHGMDVCTMLAVSQSRVVHYNAYAMTERDCSINH